MHLHCSWLLLLTALPVPAPAQSAPLTAEAIMARVAANQDRTEAERAHFVYVQQAKVQSRKGHTVLCEEITSMRVTPTPDGQQQSLLSLSGHVRDGARVLHYTALPQAEAAREQNDHGGGSDDGVEINLGDQRSLLDVDANNKPVHVKDTDIDLVESMRRSFTSDKSKDGLNAGLFPLTSGHQAGMAFELKARESKNGRDTFHVVFHPRDKADYGWKGDAWIDATAFEPVVVRTALSRALPLSVRALLGTNVPGLGFTVIYAPQEGDVWFPSSFGTEFEIKVLFFFRRQIVVSVENQAFERTHVQTTIHADEAKPVSSAEPRF